MNTAQDIIEQLNDANTFDSVAETIASGVNDVTADYSTHEDAAASFQAEQQNGTWIETVPAYEQEPWVETYPAPENTEPQIESFPAIQDEAPTITVFPHAKSQIPSIETFPTNKPKSIDDFILNIISNYKPVNYTGTTKVNGKVIDISRRVYQYDDIDWNRVDIESGLNNKQLAQKGFAPYANDGTKIELHHLLQMEPGTMVEISASLHDEYNKILHQWVKSGESFRNDTTKDKQYNNFKRKYWRWRAKNL